MDRKLNYQHVFETIVNTTSKYITSYGIKGMVLGLSGGLDSTVCAAICSKVCQLTGIPLHGISLPCSTNKESENNSALLAGKEFCNTFDVTNLQDIYESSNNFCKNIVPSFEPTNISKGNIKARLRMITLYDIASRIGGIVIGTSNTTERLTGFWTLHGDEGDINPIGDLWKTEVYGLAKYLLENVFKDSDALKTAIEITPTDGNGVSNSDADQIMPGYTYNDIDAILKVWDGLSPKVKEKMAFDKLTDSIKGTVFEPEHDEERRKRIEYCKKCGEEFKEHIGTIYGIDNIRKVIFRVLKTEYKRNRGELYISINGPLEGKIVLSSNMPKEFII